MVHLPIHGDLHRILDGKGPASDHEQILHVRGACDLPDSVHCPGHLTSVEVGVGDIVDSDSSQASLLFHDVGVVPSHCQRGEAGEEVEEISACPSIMEPVSLTSIKVDHEFIPVGENPF